MSEAAAIQVAPDHYEEAYDHRRRFLSYWNQIDQIRKTDPETILEVGIGNGFVTRYLRDKGYDTHTVDYDARLGPDTVASVLELPFEDCSFDVVCCFETLEHLPWEDFVPALKELRRVARRKVLISLPDVSPYFSLRIGFQFLRHLFDFRFEYPNLRPRRHRFDGQHFWEIGKKGYGLRRIEAAFSESGLRIAEMHRDYEDPFHRFFSTEPET